jgi:hypothetical protein
MEGKEEGCKQTDRGSSETRGQRSLIGRERSARGEEHYGTKASSIEGSAT